MTKIGVRLGVDLVDVGRVERMLRDDAGFLAMAFTDSEQAACGHDAARLAARWAAKEAVMKALGRGIGRIAPLDIEVRTDNFGEPSLSITGSAQRRAIELGVTGWTVTLSHERDMAIAAVIAVIGGEHE